MYVRIILIRLSFRIRPKDLLSIKERKNIIKKVTLRIKTL
jgi:hypothetical protein